MIKWIIILLLALGVGTVLAYDPGKEQWEAVGPRWACLLNPEKYDFCSNK